MLNSVINIGLIGCGGFAKLMSVPILKANAKYKIYAVADILKDPVEEMAKLTGAVFSTTNINEIFNDKNIDAVLITTRHDSHAELCIKAARAGKHIICEKPMGLNAQECKAVTEAVRKAGVKYTVGYNRGLAPMITKARNLLKTLPSDAKKMIYHRIQAPFPEDHWTHDPLVGGGRFVGEGCHIFDLLCELVDAPPISVYAAGGTFLDPAKVHIPDSAAITITFADGSVGTTIINSVGCPDFLKEATEIYCANKAIFISDFRHMETYGFENNKKIVTDFELTDKGHAIELDMFADAVIKNTPEPNGLIKASRAATISFLINKSIETGAPISISEADYNF